MKAAHPLFRRTLDWVAEAIDDRRSLIAGAKQGVLIGVAVLAVTLQPSGSASSRMRAPGAANTIAQDAGHALPEFEPTRTAEFAGEGSSEAARRIADWVAGSRDNRQLPFAILDKRAAELFVFDRNARLIGASRVLLGAAPGDDSVVGIGDKPMDQVRPDEKTTPAGRFISRPGRNAGGEEVIWVDHAAAVSMHRVRIVDPNERRLERLASAIPQDRRISYGCINVPVAFFDHVLKPTLGAAAAVVYVLPERKPLEQVFPAYDVAINTR